MARARASLRLGRLGRSTLFVKPTSHGAGPSHSSTPIPAKSSAGATATYPVRNDRQRRPAGDGRPSLRLHGRLSVSFAFSFFHPLVDGVVVRRSGSCRSAVTV